ncbi:hypothetical protein [Pleionea sp. CnH1-48]|uniref:hypothetical protein n=1 Tax=Pleionea sp. CnH1-48 TaxID=2954494 RepID=UPI0020975E7A|nr:hypothetical protein [Pleionea sp. CnH1-48]MCO7225113.1 hypothetical protein [Pleionea sp. CnH1-48]
MSNGKNLIIALLMVICLYLLLQTLYHKNGHSSLTNNDSLITTSKEPRTKTFETSTNNESLKKPPSNSSYSEDSSDPYDVGTDNDDFFEQLGAKIDQSKTIDKSDEIPQQYALEERDPDWALPTEIAIDSALTQSYFNHQQTVTLPECKHSICRLDYQLPEFNREALVDSLQRLAASLLYHPNLARLQIVTSNDDSGAVRVYLSDPERQSDDSDDFDYDNNNQNQ